MRSEQKTQEPRSREQVIGAATAWAARWSIRLVAIAAALVVIWLALRVSWPILFPVVLAMILCTVLGPVGRFLERRLRMPPTLAAVLTMLGSALLFVAISLALESSVQGQAGRVASDANQGLQQVQDWLQRTDFVTQDQLESGLQQIQQRLQDSASTIASGALVGVSKVTSGLVTLVITLVLTFLFLKDGRKFLPWLGTRAGPTAGRHLQEVGQRAWDTLGGFIRTQALVSLIDAIFIGAGLLLVGVPLAIPLAVLTFFGGFVPIVGAFVVGAVAVLVALVSNGLTGALIILAVIVVVQQLEGNVLSPWLQAKSMQLPAAVILLSVAIGSSLFGITGAFLAVPVAAVLAVVLRYLDDLVTEATHQDDRGTQDQEQDSDAGVDAEEEQQSQE